jgi:protein-disulfide isomerase
MTSVQEEAPSDDLESRDPKFPGSDRRTFSRRWLLGAAASGLVLGGGGGFAGGFFYAKPAPKRAQPAHPALVPLEAHSPRRGPSPAKVTIVEFSDIQCPHCDRGRQIVHALDFPEVANVVRHMPLSFHKRARPAAVAVQAAQRQEKGWDLYVKLFENRSALTDEDLVRYAGELSGLDLARFQADLADPSVAKEVEEDMKMAQGAKVSSTPSFFVNGRGVRGAKPREIFVQIIEEELAAVEELLKSGVPLADVYLKRSEANVKLGPR